MRCDLASTEGGAGQMATVTHGEADRPCYVCGKPACNIVSHRLQSLEMSRRVGRHGSRSKRQQEVSELSQLRPLVKRSANKLVRSPSDPNPESSDLTEDFPVKNSSKTVINFFRAFFTSQQRSALRGSLLRSQQGLFFDRDHYQPLLLEASENAALCLSLVAMSATYIAIHDRRLKAPDDTLTVIYNKAFQSLRQQLRKERASGIIPSESTVLAAINLSMACGVAFCDAQAAITHWHGVLALVSWDSRHYYSGDLNVFLEHIMYWLTLVAKVEPTFTHWPCVVDSTRMIPELYGHAWRDLLLSFRDEIPTTEVLELCTHVCRATEILEYRVQHSDGDCSMASMTYFQYLRSTIEQKGALIFRASSQSSTATEAVVIAVNIFYCLILAVTPWKAPIVYLCSQLQRAITQWNHTSATETETGIEDSRFLLAWLLYVYLYASRTCRDEEMSRWGQVELSRVLAQVSTRFQSEHGYRESLLEGMRRFCWSEAFMTGDFIDVCDELLEVR